ncbi:hypothetical protein LTR17_025473 [Elasticomyces elasticus]|nr:hypothetical protein LTR17_025473 [Elasticomyces elasticus]
MAAGLVLFRVPCPTPATKLVGPNGFLKPVVSVEIQNEHALMSMRPDAIQARTRQKASMLMKLPKSVEVQVEDIILGRLARSVGIEQLEMVVLDNAGGEALFAEGSGM